MGRLTKRLHDLDDKVLGRPIPDVRPLRERLLRPRPSVWSAQGRVAMGVLVLGMFLAIWLLPQVAGVIVVVALLAAGFLVSAADERKRSREFGDRRDL